MKLATVTWLVAMAAPSAVAQTLDQIREAVRAAASESRYATFLTVLTDFATDGELAGGRFDVDDLSLSSLTFPWSSDLVAADAGVGLRAEAVFGYASARLDIPDLWSGDLPGVETRVKSRYTAVVGDVGLGPTTRVADHLELQVLAHGGLSWIENKSLFSGPGAAVTQAITDGILFNWSGLYGSYGGSAALRRDGLDLGGDVAAALTVRYDLRRTEGVDVEDPALDAGDTTQWLIARADVDGPTDWAIASHPLRWHSDLGYRRLLGDGRDLLGFDDYFEIGVGLSVRSLDDVPVVSELGLGGAIMIGEDVFGWSLGVTLRF